MKYALSSRFYKPYIVLAVVSACAVGNGGKKLLRPTFSGSGITANEQSYMTDNGLTY